MFPMQISITYIAATTIGAGITFIAAGFSILALDRQR